jgi:hypothetical protein
MNFFFDFNQRVSEAFHVSRISIEQVKGDALRTFRTHAG